MLDANSHFFSSVLAGGAIVAGFCAVFLQFRIQREANFYREPGCAHQEQHFTTSFLLIILASILSFGFGVVMPLLGLAKIDEAWIAPKVIVGGLLAAIFLLPFYFFNELIHFRIICKRDDEFWREFWVVVVALIISTLIFAWAYRGCHIPS
jgi:hypothetical protein